MNTITKLLIASTISAAAATQALAAWDQTQVRDPAFSKSYDRQLETAGMRLHPEATASGSMVATHDTASMTIDQRFGPDIDRATGRASSPHDH